MRKQLNPSPRIIIVFFLVVSAMIISCKSEQTAGSNNEISVHLTPLKYQAVMQDSNSSNIYLTRTNYKLINGDTADDLRNKIKDNIRFDVSINGTKVRESIKYKLVDSSMKVFDSMGFSCILNTYDIANYQTGDLTLLKLKYPKSGGDSIVVTFYVDVLKKLDLTKGDRYVSSVNFKTPLQPQDTLTIGVKSAKLPLGSSFSFYDSSSPTPVSFVWNFGDGNKSYEQNPTHNYSRIGTYKVLCMATFQDRKILRDSLEVQVINEPDSIFITKMELLDFRINETIDPATSNHLPDLYFRVMKVGKFNYQSKVLVDANPGRDKLIFELPEPILYQIKKNTYTGVNFNLYNENIITDGGNADDDIGSGALMMVKSYDYGLGYFDASWIGAAYPLVRLYFTYR